MVLVTNVALAMVCCIYCCICWGSWANTQKLVQKKDWKSFLFYWDYIAGFFLTAIIGLLAFNGGHLFENITWQAAIWPLLGGLIWNFSNIFLTAANGVAGMAVGFPIGGGLGWVGGIIFNASNILLSASTSISGMSVAFPLGVGLLYFLLYPLDLGHRWFGARVWNIAQMETLCLISALECCIQTGLIPANTDYGRLFSLGELSAVILDEQGRPVYRSGGESWPFPEREDLEVRRVPIPGGSLEWAADLSDLAALNAQIKENNRRLAQRNAFLREEGRLKKEHAELETRNQLYEQISRAVGPQLEEIGALAESEGDAFLGSLPRICVLTAFIKRRSNMELLSKDGTLPVEELAAALEESMEYLRLCGIAAAVQRFAKGVYPAQVIFAAYEHTQAIVMEGLDTLTAVSVIVRDAAGLELRLLVKAQSLSWDFGAVPPGISGVQPRIQVTKEGEDLTIVLRFPGGGGIVP